MHRVCYKRLFVVQKGTSQHITKCKVHAIYASHIQGGATTLVSTQAGGGGQMPSGQTSTYGAGGEFQLEKGFALLHKQLMQVR